jgi:hypothetical protein
MKMGRGGGEGKKGDFPHNKKLGVWRQNLQRTAQTTNSISWHYLR